jgi:poly-beta-hydroxyalkanoate depolymerase
LAQLGDYISLNGYILRMLNGVVHTHQTSSIQQPIVIVLVAIALVAVVGGFIFISNYVMPNIHQVCHSRLGPLHCYKVQYHEIF